MVVKRKGTYCVTRREETSSSLYRDQYAASKRKKGIHEIRTFSRNCFASLCSVDRGIPGVPCGRSTDPSLVAHRDYFAVLAFYYRPENGLALHLNGTTWARVQPEPREGKSFAEHDPRLHVEKIKHLLNDVARHAREDMMRVSDPKAQALFETTAEGLQGLAKAFDDYEEKREKAWKTAGAE
jgi:hypothetical protein